MAENVREVNLFSGRRRVTVCIQDWVRYQLVMDEATRSSDKLLFVKYWEEFMSDAGVREAFMGVPVKTIERTRRMVQRKYPHLKSVGIVARLREERERDCREEYSDRYTGKK